MEEIATTEATEFVSNAAESANNVTPSISDATLSVNNATQFIADHPIKLKSTAKQQAKRSGVKSEDSCTKSGKQQQQTSMKWCDRAPSIPWSYEDDFYLLQLIRQIGYGAWTKIAQAWKEREARSLRQIKNRATHVRETGCGAQPDITQGFRDAFEARYGKDADPRGKKKRQELKLLKGKSNKSKKKARDDETSDDEEDEIDDVDEMDEADLAVDETNNHLAVEEIEEGDWQPSEELASAEESVPLIETSTQKENSENGALIILQTTDVLSVDELPEQERKENAAFFDGSNPEISPQLYLAIRNEIVRLWSGQKPIHLTLKVCKQALKAAGYANNHAVNSVYTYLDSCQLINSIDGTNLVVLLEAPVETKQPNKVRQNKAQPRKPKAQTIKPSKKLSGIVNDEKDDLYDDDYLQSTTGQDQFCLVAVKNAAQKRSSFRVEIDASQLAFADFHSHLMHTEVIGLLGGRYFPDTGLVVVSSTFPCRSISSGTECEMDPMSELEASMHFSKLDLEIVGWYHSHPLFQPDPSIRDLDTQLSYQQLVTDQGATVRPFVGLIVSPYDKATCTKPPYHSSYRIFYVVEELDQTTMRYQKPVQCPLTIRESSPALGEFQSLLESCEKSGEFVNLLEPLGNGSRKATASSMQRIDKMKCSLRQYFKDEGHSMLIDEFIDQLKVNLISIREQINC